MVKHPQRKLQALHRDPQQVYIAFNKPYAVLCQFSQSEDVGKSTLANFGFPKDVYPVGRLDFDSEGLLLLSNDGSFTHQLLNPDFAHGRTYYAQVENIPDESALSALERGVMIEGRCTLPTVARLLSAAPGLPERPVPIRFRKNIPTSWIGLTLNEGRNRQVRRMTAAVGHPTLRLVRVAIGKLNLFELGLQPGGWIHLTSEQVKLALEL